MTSSDLLLQKALIASDIDSSQWNRIQAGLKNRAFFSSRVTQVNLLSAIRERVAEYSKGSSDLSKIRMEIREKLREGNYEPLKGTEGTIKDLRTQSRLDVIIKTNVAQMRGYIQHIVGTTAGGYAAFPAQEFRRIRHSRHPRADWQQKWEKAGGKFYSGRMIALKDDPVWQNLGNLGPFGNPYPPFDWGSGMGVLDVDQATAIELGLIKLEEIKSKVEEMKSKPAPDFNRDMQATVPNLRSDSLCGRVLKRDFGDQIVIENSSVHWQGNLIKDLLSGKRPKVQLGIGYNGRPLPLSHNFFKEHLSKHYGSNETNPQNIPLRDSDFELIPAMWHNPDKVSRSGNRDHLEFETLDGGILHLFTSNTKGIRSFYKTKSGRSLQ